MKTPIFVIAGLFAAGAFAADKTAVERVLSVEFTPTAAPRSEADRVRTYTTSSAVVTYAGGKRKAFALSYHTLFRAGDRIGGGTAGLVVDRDGQPIMNSMPGAGGDSAQGPFHAYAPDANSLIRVGRGTHEKLFLVTHYEYHTEAPLVSGKGTLDLYAQLPAAMSLSGIRQDRKTGKLAAGSIANIDMKDIGGLWIPCAGSLTPWNTHIGGEEYEPNARQFETEPLDAMNLYLKTPGKRFDAGGANPYRYGHPVEVAVAADGSTRVAKRYAMGRLSTELADIMPDERTAYVGDDGRDTMMFMFIADRPRDLSAGTLYAARWEQTAAGNGGAAKLVWIRLGHATEAEIAALIDRGIRYSDIFDTVSAAEVNGDPEKYREYKPVFVYEGQGGMRTPGSGAKQEVAWLKVKPGMEQAAAFLESRRYGAVLGATSEFTKMEGVTHNAADRRLYMAMSYVEAGMLDGQNGARPQDHVRLQGDAKDLACGAVYEARLDAGQKDAAGTPIASDWVAATMQSVLLGARKPFGQAYAPYDRCDTERIANPDNIKYSQEMRTLFIGEDSGNHLNNFLWAWNIDSGNLVRIASAPAGAEHTGLQVVPNVNGHSYIMGNVQHPGAGADLKQYPDEVRIGLRAKIDQRGSVGYIGGLPELRR